MGIDQDSEDEEPYPVYSCHALCPNQYTLFTLCASRLEDLKKLSSEFLPDFGCRPAYRTGKKANHIYRREHE